MTAFAEMFAFIIVLWILTIFTVLIWGYMRYFSPKLAYDRYYDAYRLKVLKDELEKKGVTLEELDELGFKWNVNRKRKVHTLKEIEESVKGELKGNEKK